MSSRVDISMAAKLLQTPEGIPQWFLDAYLLSQDARFPKIEDGLAMMRRSGSQSSLCDLLDVRIEQIRSLNYSFMHDCSRNEALFKTLDGLLDSYMILTQEVSDASRELGSAEQRPDNPSIHSRVTMANFARSNVGNAISSVISMILSYCNPDQEDAPQ